MGADLGSKGVETTYSERPIYTPTKQISVISRGPCACSIWSGNPETLSIQSDCLNHVGWKHQGLSVVGIKAWVLETLMS